VCVCVFFRRSEFHIYYRHFCWLYNSAATPRALLHYDAVLSARDTNMLQ